MELSSKFSLYDILAMIIPGGVILASILIEFGYPQTFEKTVIWRISEPNINLIRVVICLVVSYVIGLINNWVCDGLYEGFRNNSMAIKKALIQTLRSNGNINLKINLNFNIKYIVGSAYDKPKECISCLSYIIACTAISIITKWIPCKSFKRKDSIVISYYKAYYALSQANLLGSVPLVENQIALLRNSIIPVAVLCYQATSGCQVLYSIIFALIIFVVMVQRQQKIYRMIWECANYYKLCK